MTEKKGVDSPLVTEPEEDEGSEQQRAYGHGPIESEGTAAAATGVGGGELPTREASLWSDAWRQLRRNPFFILSVSLIAIFTAMAVAPGLFTSADPRHCLLENSVDPPSARHWFGFDIQGCDYFARVVHGTDVSLRIGLLVVFVDVAIAVVLGSIAGFYSRAADAVVSRVADIWFAIPTTLGAIVFLNAIGQRGVLEVSAILIILGWPTMMRLMRSSVLSVKEMDYVQAARALGARDLRILRVHILPNGIAPVIVYGTITVGIIISAEAALSFLGVGLQLPAISWGLMISDAQYRINTSPHLLFFPALFLSILVFSFILLGDTLRDALDPKLR